jgi:hypothetical protein
MHTNAALVSGCIKARQDGIFYIGVDYKIHRVYWTGSMQYEAINPNQGWTKKAYPAGTIIFNPSSNNDNTGQAMDLETWPNNGIIFRSEDDKIYRLSGTTSNWNLASILPANSIDCNNDILVENKTELVLVGNIQVPNLRTIVYYKGSDKKIHNINYGSISNLWQYDAMTLINPSGVVVNGHLAKESGQDIIYYKGANGAVNMYLYYSGAPSSGWLNAQLTSHTNIIAGDLVAANGQVYCIGVDKFVYAYWQYQGWNLNALRYDIANAKGCSSNYRIGDLEDELIEEPQLQINIDNSNNLSVYPNPSNTQFNIRLNLEEESSAFISVLSADGRLIFRQEVNSNSIYDYMIETTEWAEGLYLIRVQAKDKVWSDRLIVKH